MGWKDANCINDVKSENLNDSFRGWDMDDEDETPKIKFSGHQK